MEIGTVSHKYYLVNVRLPVIDHKVNWNIGDIKDVHLVVSMSCVTINYVKFMLPCP